MPNKPSYPFFSWWLVVGMRPAMAPRAAVEVKPGSVLIDNRAAIAGFSKGGAASI